MKKVLIFADFNKFGGTRTYFKNLVDYYLLDDYQIVTAIDKDYCDQDILEFLTKNNIKKIFLSRKNRNGIFSRFPLGIIVDHFLGFSIIVKERPNLILISTGSPGKFLGLMLLFPLKIIYILHSYPTCIRPHFFYRLLLLFYRLLLLTSLNENKRILTVSKFSKNQIVKCWLTDKKQKYVDYIYNFSNLENNSSIPKESGITDVKKILTLGHVVWYKNPDIWYSVAVKTIQKYPGDLEFLWVGGGDLLDTYREKVKNDNMPQIKFLGFQKNVTELYNQSAIYFQPSRLESHGIAVVDAMLMAVPCIVSNAGGLPESVVDGKTGYVVNPDNINEMVSRLLNLLENENLRVSMGKAGKEYYENTFSYKRWIQEMKRLNEIFLGVY
jgi:glycosyltransferase involved in cell wall biosynthesis